MVVNTKLGLQVLASVIEEVVDTTAVLAAELLTHLGELAHALLPVVELLYGAVVLVLTAHGDGFSDELVQLVLPFAENASVQQDLLNIPSGWALAEAISKVLSEWLERDIALKGFVSLVELLGESLESLSELFLLVSFAHLPVIRVHLLEHGSIDVVYEGLQGSHGVLRDLSEEDLFVAGTLRVNGSAGLGVSEEEDTLTNELVVQTCRKDIFINTLN